MIQKRKIETSSQSSQPNKSTKYHCRKCGDNNSHSSETCRVIGKLIDDSQKSIKPKSDDKSIPIKPIKQDYKTINQDKPHWLNKERMDKIHENFKNRYSRSSGHVPSTNTNNLSDYAGGTNKSNHDDPDVDYDFESELEDLEE